MTILSVLLVGFGGSIGAVLRFYFSEKWNSVSFPAGTLAVNWAGSFLLGTLIGAGISGMPFLFAGAGFAGALTTFSTMQVEGLALYKRNGKKKFLLYQAVMQAELLLPGRGRGWEDSSCEGEVFFLFTGLYLGYSERNEIMDGCAWKRPEGIAMSGQLYLL